MKIGINNLEYLPKLKDKEVIYIFDKEPLEELLKTNLHCIDKDNVEHIDINLTNYDIPCYKKCTIEDDLSIPPKKDYKFGIIIPNYNYEQWIDKCLNSIEEQTYKNYEVIFVDDCSIDNSVKIAKSFQDKINIKIIQLKQKRLNGGARNEAYLHLSKDVDYIMYIDSDDWLLNENVLQDINNSLRGTPDVLFIGMSDFINNKTQECYEPKYRDKYEAMQGWSGSCGKVIKKELATRQECLYNEGTLKEDRNQHRKICIYMNTFQLLKKPLYVWNRTNTKSVTTVREKEIWGTSTIRQYADTLQLYLQEKGKDKKIDCILEEAVEKCKKEMEKGGDCQW